jgi:methylmalonyl-CoA/ethylmalonyl-CoA epimerase
MGIERVLEVGIVVRDLDKAIKLFTEVLGLTPGEIEIYEPYKMRFNLCRLGEVYFELIEPTASEGPIAKFIQTHGEGLHHIALKVSNIEETMSQLREQGIQFTEETPLYLQVGYGKVKFAFVHPQSLHGVLIELIETI